MRITSLLVTAAATAACQLPASCAVLYVSPAGNNSADGRSWASAKRTISEAAAAAAFGDEIWVAAGTYTTPVALRSGVAVYGGFAGTESTRNERDPAANPVFLTVPGPQPAVTFYNNASVLTRLDGLRITGCGGDAIRAPEGMPSIHGCEITGNAGAGIVCEMGSPAVVRCRISGNGGAGVVCDTYASPALSLCTLAGNRGGGVVCAGESAPVVDRCFIRDNGSGGILSTASSPVVQGCVISGSAGPGVSCREGSAAVLINNTVAANSGAGLELEPGARAANNIVAFNASGIVIPPGAEAPALVRNCVFGNTAGDYIGMAPPAGDLRADPQFVAPGSGDFRIRPSSPCRDAGDDASVSNLPSDIEGRARRIGAAVDIGAYELDGTAAAVSGIPDVRRAPPGTSAEGVRGVVSAAWSGVFYLQKEDRACGIRVEQAGHALVPGDRASVSGTAGVTGTGEVCLLASSSIREGTAAVRAVGVTGKALRTGRGVGPDGLLVRIAGRVTHRDAAAGSFTVDDGSELRDRSGHPGVRVSCPGLPVPAAGAAVVVTGALSLEQAGGQPRPLILPRSAQDIVSVSP